MHEGFVGDARVHMTSMGFVSTGSSSKNSSAFSAFLPPRQFCPRHGASSARLTLGGTWLPRHSNSCAVGSP